MEEGVNYSVISPNGAYTSDDPTFLDVTAASFLELPWGLEQSST